MIQTFSSTMGRTVRRHLVFAGTALLLCAAAAPPALAESPKPQPRRPAPARVQIDLPAAAPAPLLALQGRAQGGEAAAQLELAERLAAGDLNDKPDIVRALHWYEKAAESGDADASWALADLYRNGLDVPVDPAKSVAWYRRAAEQGHAEAMYDLALLYFEGGLVDRDPVEAAAWFERAADAGIARALFMLGIVFEQGADGAPDLETARAWYARAAETGDATAQAALDRLAAGRRNVELAAVPDGALRPATAAPAAEQRRAEARTAQGSQAAPRPPRDAARDVPVDQKGIREIQTRLVAAGHKIGKPDGHLGKRTVAAIQSYQRANGLKVDGRPTQALLAHLRGNPAKS